MLFDEFQTFLDQAIIPKIKAKPRTFLDISKQPHYENVISNLYSFFFDVNAEHGLNDLFIRSLIKCIHDNRNHNKNFSGFSDFSIHTEYATKGLGPYNRKGRIDILLKSQDQAILIENKIYHYLANDLDDYWKSVKVDSDDHSSKIGIILSLKPVSQNLYQQFEFKDHFINLTHEQLMRKVYANAPKYLENNTSRFIYLFEDFYQNIMNISHPVMNSSEIEFYLTNQAKINQLVKLKQHLKKHVVAEVEKAGHSINEVKLIVPKHKSNAIRLRYYRSTRFHELLYTVVYEDVFTDKGVLHIIIEPRGNTLKNGEEFKNIVFTEEEQEIIKKEFYGKTDHSYAHFAHKAYDLKAEDISKLSTFILDKIGEDGFASIFEKLLHHLGK